MRNTQKFVLTCCCMIGAGVLLSGAGYAMGGRVWGIGINSGGVWVNTPNIVKDKSYTYSFKEETKELEKFTRMEIGISYGDLVIEPSDHYGISYCVDSTYDFSVKVVDGCLKVTDNPLAYFGVSGNLVFFGRGSNTFRKDEFVKIYVPADADFHSMKLTDEFGNVTGSNVRAEEFELHADYGNVNINGLESEKASIQLSSGNLKLTDFSDGDLAIKNSYGKAELKNVTAKTISAKMESGDIDAIGIKGERVLLDQAYGAIKLEDAVITGEAELSDESGEITLNDMESDSLVLNNQYGNVKGDGVKIRNGNFVLESGDCTVTEFDVEQLEIGSQYGSVKLALTNAVENYTLKLSTDYGRVKINGEDMGDTYKSLETYDKTLVVNCESGDITISR